MLKLTRMAAIFMLAGAVLLVAPMRAQADPFGDTRCDNNPSAPGCDVTAGNPGGGDGSNQGNGGGRGGDGKCRKPSGEVIPCERDGAWAGTDGCYYAPTDPSPSTIAALGGQPAGEGGWYMRTCYGDGGSFGGIVWIAGAPPVISPAVLARQARARLDLPKVVIRMNPPGDQLVNLPVWLALDRGSWRSQSATASVSGVSVTATARPVKANWSMGDGVTVTCTGPGTVWALGSDPKKASPDCGHVYRRSSAVALQGVFAVTVTVTWEVTWAGAGQSGTVPGLTTTGQVQTRVQESQAVTR
ncbi:ATP/GTP-binding protein [Micromonospora sonneratiae]|uniref:ATP/GTP-binding protein n=1 Tax=Micromonospora sonneratiae TaxID=1184706 RepID=A0ABW3YRI9_9ACTN